MTISEPRSEASARQSLRQQTYPRRQFLAYQRQIVGQDVSPRAGSDPDHPMTFETWLAEAEQSAS
ncbi:hypothetical protein [Nocardioides ferulae]|uniref:hypothetical protein n=1 Tax=Nocardioides ferulae TaxID=2340821 RepID=UPI000EAD5758|nr:hypothetical protein [Nocardioides ferulae]